MMIITPHIHCKIHSTVSTLRYYSTAIRKCNWQSVVGLEVHAQIQSASKLFSGSQHSFTSPVNTNVSLFDGSIPGTLPVLNRKCVEAGVLTALALNCNINPVSMFDRKHYFYADMPAGYQITQQRSPLANNGFLQFEVFPPGGQAKCYNHKAKIKQLQLEQDSGKSLHDTDRSLVDLNRAGAPLMEIVFEPDLSDGEEAAALIKELVNILKRLNTCSCKMEEGALRVDANVSVRRDGEPLGTRTEIKNIGSIRAVAGAIKYEIQRQIALLDSGARIVNETRAWDAEAKKTVAMRDKEVQQDYRYMPEPNLPPLHVAKGPVEYGCVNVNDLMAKMPELPEETRKRLCSDFGILKEHAIILVNEEPLLNLFEKSVLTSTHYKMILNLLLNEVLTIVNKEHLDLNELCKLVTPETMCDVASFLSKQVINRPTAKDLLEKKMFGATESIEKLIEINGWVLINDDLEIERICKEAIQANQKLVEKYKKGKTKAFQTILGTIDSKYNHRINMAKVDTQMKRLLDS